MGKRKELNRALKEIAERYHDGQEISDATYAILYAGRFQGNDKRRKREMEREKIYLYSDGSFYESSDEKSGCFACLAKKWDDERHQWGTAFKMSAGKISDVYSSTQMELRGAITAMNIAMQQYSHYALCLRMDCKDICNLSEDYLGSYGEAIDGDTSRATIRQRFDRSPITKEYNELLDCLDKMAKHEQGFEIEHIARCSSRETRAVDASASVRGDVRASFYMRPSELPRNAGSR